MVITHYPQRLRIIGGQWRRSVIKVPPFKHLRPTPDRLRETLFNWLASTVNGAHCLDLFCGSGILGLECLSRGASSVYMIDLSDAMAENIQAFLKARSCDKGKLIIQDALQWLDAPQLIELKPFDIIFFDPPYSCSEQMIQLCWEKLSARKLLTKHTQIFIDSSTDLTHIVPRDWQLIRQQRTGAALGSLYRQSTEAK